MQNMETVGTDSTTISISNVTHEYPTSGGAVRALQDVSLDVEPNEIVTVVGPSGCGKSTLLTLVAGLTFPTEGDVKIGDARVTGPDSRLGMMFQSDLLLDWRTVLENVLLQSDIRGQKRSKVIDRAKELLEVAQLGEFADRSPWELSGGMRQRVAICRTLLHNPRILLMDEPFAALDALTRDQMTRFLEELWETDPRTIMFVTHSIPEAVFLATRVVVMSSRPARIKKIVEIDLPRPRTEETRNSAEYSQYVAEIRSYFE